MVVVASSFRISARSGPDVNNLRRLAPGHIREKTPSRQFSANHGAGTKSRQSSVRGPPRAASRNGTPQTSPPCATVQAAEPKRPARRSVKVKTGRLSRLVEDIFRHEILYIS